VDSGNRQAINSRDRGNLYLSLLAVVIADTHLPRRASALPEGLIPYLERADLILHAGDLMDPTLLDELAAYAPVRAVRGNLDPPEATLPETVEFEFGGVSIAMIHDSGPKKGRRNRMKRRFQRARVVVFGHSHIPWLQDEDGVLLLNPGSPTDRRRQPEHTLALLRVEGGEVRAEVLALRGRRRLAKGGKPLDYNFTCGGGRAQEIRQQ
jgi:putative phosphoesterase